MRKRYEKDFDDTPQGEKARFSRAAAKRYGVKRDWAAIAKKAKEKDAEDSRK